MGIFQVTGGGVKRLGTFTEILLGLPETFAWKADVQNNPPLTWLEKMKKFEPTKLVKYLSAGLKLASALGWLGFTSTQIGLIDTQLGILAPLIIEAVVQALDWLAHRWLRNTVTSPATAETMAAFVVEVKKSGVEPPEKVLKAAKRALD